MTWTLGGEPDEPGDYVVVMGRRSRWLMTWNERDRRWYDGQAFREPRWIKAYYRVPDFPKEWGIK